MKALIILTQDFYEHKPGNGNPDLAPYTVTINESNLVKNISLIMHAHRHQRDRLADVMDGNDQDSLGGLMEAKYKYLFFAIIGEKPKTKVWGCYNIRSGSLLGRVAWYGP